MFSRYLINLVLRKLQDSSFKRQYTTYNAIHQTQEEVAALIMVYFIDKLGIHESVSPRLHTYSWRDGEFNTGTSYLLCNLFVCVCVCVCVCI